MSSRSRSTLVALSVVISITVLTPAASMARAASYSRLCQDIDGSRGERIIGKCFGERAGAQLRRSEKAPQDDWPADMILDSFRTYARPSATRRR